MANNQNVDLTPGANPVALGGPGLHFHSPGKSAGEFNDPSSFPSTNPLASGPKAVTVKVTGTPGVVIKFSNPS
jgi:hypothetical protein